MRKSFFCLRELEAEFYFSESCPRTWYPWSRIKGKFFLRLKLLTCTKASSLLGQWGGVWESQPPALGTSLLLWEVCPHPSQLGQNQSGQRKDWAQSTSTEPLLRVCATLVNALIIELLVNWGFSSNTVYPLLCVFSSQNYSANLKQIVQTWLKPHFPENLLLKYINNQTLLPLLKSMMLLFHINSFFFFN